MPLEKRQDITTTIDVIETVEIVVIDVVTVWLPPGANPAPSDQQQQVAQPNKPNPAPVVHITPVEDVAIPVQTPPQGAQQGSPEAVQNQANRAQEQKNQAQAAKNQAAQEQSIQKQNQANQAQEQANENKVAQNQAAPAPQSPPPVVPVNSPPAVPPATQDTSSSDQTQPKSGGSCGEIGGTCTATNVTYFGGGMGACGWSNDTTSEDFFALAHGRPPPTLLPLSPSVHNQSKEVTDVTIM